jgi:hypothetical protein
MHGKMFDKQIEFTSIVEYCRSFTSWPYEGGTIIPYVELIT